MPHPLKHPSEATPDKQIQIAVDDLLSRADEFKLWLSAHPERENSGMRALLFEHFSSEDRYDARWSMRALLFADDESSLARVIQAGIPIEAPIGFARGSIACEAADIGSRKCLILLDALGADLNSPNEHGDTPIELAAELCSENIKGAQCCEILLARGAFASIDERQENLRARTDPALGADPPIMPSAPLAALMLHSLRRDWDDVVGRNRRAGRSMAELCYAVAGRIDALQKACAQADIDFIGPSLSQLLAKMELPADIELALASLRELAALQALGLTPPSTEHGCANAARL